MAKLHNYHILCALIDQKSFLGVATYKDSENVIVTLGRNVVNKHRLSDQKQIGGWTSKDHITSPVVYDHELESYIGVFNNNSIKTWKDDTDNLEKVKKYKFSLNILKVLPRSDQTSLIIFSNGNCATLSYGLENRKTFEGKSVIKSLETIIDVNCYTYNNVDNICYIIHNNKDKYEIIFCPLRHELGDLEKAKLTRVKIERPENDVYVVGKLVCVADTPVVYILWSDSKMTVYDLLKRSWKVIGTVPWISCLTDISLAWMGDKHLILFGSNMDQEGGIIVAYNISLGVGSCRYPMKMYSEGAKLYCFNQRIILESSNHIGMLPYVVETTRSLSSLLGSHEVIQDDHTEIASWGNTTKLKYKVDEELNSVLSLGVTERVMASQVIPPLLEKDDFKKIVKLTTEIKDMPESVLVQLIAYCIKSVQADNVDVTHEEKFKNFCSGSLQAPKLELLINLFQIPFSDALLIPYLRNGLNINNSMFLITYISYLVENSEHKFDTDYESKLFDWCILLMDAFYQQYLLIKDEKLTYVLENVKCLVERLIDQVMTIDSLMPMLNNVIQGKSIEDNEEMLPYTIQLMQI